MKRFSFNFWFAALAIMLVPAACWSQTPSKTSNECEVVVAVAPAFPPTARSARAKGDVIVEVQVNPRGDVKSSKAVSGNPLLQNASQAVARQWKFAPISGERDRIIRLTFSFGYVVGDRNEPKYTVKFMPPYRVELRWNPAEEADFKL